MNRKPALTALVLALLTLAISVAPAQAERDRVGKLGTASEDLAHVETDRAADGQLWSATRVAEAYWAAPSRVAEVRERAAARGVAECGPLVPSIAPVPLPDDHVDGQVKAEAADGWAAIGSCAFSITPKFAAASRGPRGWWTRLDLRNECDTTVHEAGHALGLTHDDADRFPVMAQDHYDEDIPRRCGAWAGRVMREWREQRRSR